MMVVAVASLVVSGCHSEDITGNLFARGGEIGSWSLDPYLCLSGEPSGWKGVQLIGDQHSVRLWIHPREGAVVLAYPPGSDPPLVFSPSSCSWFGAKFEQTNAYINDVRVVNGEIDIECETDAGELHGRVAFDGCH